VVGTDGFGRVEFGKSYTIDIFIFIWGGCTAPQPVPPCTEGASFLSSTVSGYVVVPAAFKASVYRYIVL
jgi:hypothetical protein